MDTILALIIAALVAAQPPAAKIDFDLEHLAICSETNEMPAETDPLEESEEIPVSEPKLAYLGEWTVTAYCSCEICCGEYATGYTASGTLATEGRTAACNSLPMGTQIMIDGSVYTIEDTGWTPYGDAWIDIYFESHDAALAYGMQTKEVYLVN